MSRSQKPAIYAVLSDAYKSVRGETQLEAISTAMQEAAAAEVRAEKLVAAAEARAESHALALKRAAVASRVEAALREREGRQLSACDART